MQEKVNHGKSDKPDKILLKNFIAEHKKLMPGQIAPTSLYEQVRAIRLFEKFIGGHVSLANIKPRHAEAYISKRIASEVSVATVNNDVRQWAGHGDIFTTAEYYTQTLESDYKAANKQSIFIDNIGTENQTENAKQETV
ncbi:MAG: hypothetical protein JXB18_11035 [Sedimentisphaerales bacterium]|nr:hypothetical protein [Sedimentisphaerales bacterium]